MDSMAVAAFVGVALTVSGMLVSAGMILARVKSNDLTTNRIAAQIETLARAVTRQEVRIARMLERLGMDEYRDHNETSNVR